MIDKATPRPWTYGGTGNFIGGADQQRVADVYRDNLSAEGRQANACLIVRAVNAYDAMREALQDMAAYFADTDAPLGQKARTALAMAERRQEGT